MQLKPRARFDKVGIARVDERPAQLRFGTELDGPAKRSRECLPAEADAEHGNSAVVRSAKETQLLSDPRPDRVCVVYRPRRAKWNKDVVRERVRKINRNRRDGEVLRRHDLQCHDIETSIGERLADVAE